MKTERIATRVYRSREQARADVFDYIERLHDLYNPDAPALGRRLRRSRTVRTSS
jgi:hypothetical protein